MRIWVTGARSLLAKALLRSLSAHQIPHRASTREEADVTNAASLADFYHKFGPFTHIVHCAAYTEVDRAESEQPLAYLVNAISPALIGALAQKHNLRVVHISTDYVFDGLAKKPYPETAPIAPATIYGITKAQGEQALLAGLPHACIVRTSWLFGPDGKNFVSTMLHLMQKEPLLRIVNDQRGRPTYTLDLAEFLIAALDWSGIYHFANQGETSWHAFATAIFNELKKPIACKTIAPISTREFSAAAKRPLYSVLDTSLAESKVSHNLRPWTEGMKELCAAWNAS